MEMESGVQIGITRENGYTIKGIAMAQFIGRLVGMNVTEKVDDGVFLADVPKDFWDAIQTVGITVTVQIDGDSFIVTAEMP